MPGLGAIALRPGSARAVAGTQRERDQEQRGGGEDAGGGLDSRVLAVEQDEQDAGSGDEREGCGGQKDRAGTERLQRQHGRL
jgi:hypothetical protein